MNRVITKEEVKKHNNEKSIWIIIHNEVYDVTKFLDEHPGGADSLLDFAGTDGTQAFEDVGHSDDAREMMVKYKIGKLPPGEQMSPTDASARGSKVRATECLVCQAASCPGLPKNTPPERSWRTYDGSPDRPKSPKTEYKTPATARAERRVQSIVVPRERRPRGPPCEGSSKLKWAILALAGAVIIGVVLKKYMS